MAAPALDFAAFDLEEIASLRRAAGRPYFEFLRVPTLNAGLYHLPAGGEDPQQPHPEDEVYYVLAGRSRFTAGKEEREVRPGQVLFVKAGLEHRFHEIREDLTLLVVFSAADPG